MNHKRPQPTKQTPEINYLLGQWDKTLVAHQFYRARGVSANIELVWISEMIRDLEAL